MAIKEPLDDPRRRSRRRSVANDDVIVVDETVLLNGFDTLLKSFGAVVKEMREASSDVRTTMDMVVRAKTDAAKLGGGIGGMLPRSAEGDPAAEVERAKRVRQATDENWKSMERGPGGRFVRRRPEPEVTPADEHAARLAADDQRREDARATNDDVQRTTGGRHPSRIVSAASRGERPSLRTPITLEGGWQGIQKQTRSGIRESVYQAAARRAETYAGDSGLTTDLSTGHVMRIAPGYTVDAATGQFVNEAGEAVPMQEATRDLGSQTHWARRALGAQTGMRALESWRGGNTSIGRSLANALPQTALRVAGYGSVALGAANQVWQGIQNQYEQNRQFQEVYGGSNTDQIGERISQWWNKNITGRFSLLGGGNYDALFKQAMQQGLRGSDRSDYIGAGASLMGQGVNQGQTGAILGIATQTGQSLDFLSAAIKRVNETAREAGVNAAKARDIFIRNYEMSSDMLYGSNQAKQMATVLTEGQLQMARMYQGVDLSGQFTGSTRQRFLAGRQGMTYTEYLSEVNANPLLAVTMGEDETRDQLNMIRSERDDGRTIGDVVTQYLDEHPDYRPEYDQADLGMAIVAAGFPPDVIAAYLRENGIQASPEQAPGIAGHLFTNRSPGSLATQELSEQQADFGPGQTGNREDYIDESWRDWQRNPRYSLDIREHYLSSVEEDEEAGTFERNPIIEELAVQAHALGIERDDINDTKILVDTAEGRMVVPLDWALQNVPDQVANAPLMEGVDDEFQGMSVAQALGVHPDVASEYTTTSGDIAISMDDLPEGVVPLETWEADREAEREASGETQVTPVTFDLTPYARQFLMPVSGASPYDTGNPENSGYITDYTNVGG